MAAVMILENSFPENVLPLYHRNSDKIAPDRAFICLNVKSGELYSGYGDTDERVTSPKEQNTIFYWDVDPRLTDAGLHRLLEDVAYKAVDVREAYMADMEHREDAPEVARTGAEARQEIAQLCSASFDSPDCADIAHPQDYFRSWEWEQLWPAELTLDEAAERLVGRAEDDESPVVMDQTEDGVADYLVDLALEREQGGKPLTALQVATIARYK